MAAESWAGASAGEGEELPPPEEEEGVAFPSNGEDGAGGCCPRYCGCYC